MYMDGTEDAGFSNKAVGFHLENDLICEKSEVNACVSF
jgi:hypothetical protein